MIGLCDCNNFFVSCERVFNPSLEGRAVLVLSSNDGCVIARSNESKALGVKMGQPLFQIRKLVEQHNIALQSSNHQLYGDMSHRVMATLKEALPSIEVYSIDEAFLDMSGIALESLKAQGEALSRRVRRNTGIPVSIGIAPTKTLAKIASKLCKSYPRLNGACLLYRPEDIAKVLDGYPIGDVWGIGRRSVDMLKMYGIKTAADFAAMPQEWINSKMGLNGLRTWRELHSEPSILFDEHRADKRSIMVSRSFARELTDFEQVRSALTGFISTAAEKLRHQKSVAQQMQIFIFTNRFREDSAQCNRSDIIRFERATDSTIEMAKAATKSLERLFEKGYAYKKVGVTLYDISPSSSVQSSLFEAVDHSKHSALMQTLDSINSQYGKSSIKLGADNRGSAHVNSEHLSPCYTTKWSDIIKVKV